VDERPGAGYNNQIIGGSSCQSAATARPCLLPLRSDYGASYRAELAHGLQQVGRDVRGRTGRGERCFEIAEAPKKLSERGSARTADIERGADLPRPRP
jgi:hypothetical protein